jgi:hypothetical protein
MDCGKEFESQKQKTDLCDECFDLLVEYMDEPREIN